MNGAIPTSAWRWCASSPSKSRRAARRYAAAVRQQAGPVSAHDQGLAQAAFAQGNRQRERNHLEAAEQHYRRALAIHPAFAEAYANLGSLLKDRGQWVDATAQLPAVPQTVEEQTQAPTDCAREKDMCMPRDDRQTFSNFSTCARPSGFAMSTSTAPA